tara:strand:- start:8834 stop:9091 length:258 start_codon:yes stop_codon:yes gene_type:complete
MTAIRQVPPSDSSVARHLGQAPDRDPRIAQWPCQSIHCADNDSCDKLRHVLARVTRLREAGFDAGVHDALNIVTNGASGFRILVP